jgi:hypothetical protein
VRLTVIVDEDARITRWQFEALSMALTQGHSIEKVVRIENKALTNHRSARNALYYMLRVITHVLLSSQKRISIFELGLQSSDLVLVQSESVGKWEKIPENSYHLFKNSEVVIKFGMGLLRDPQDIPTKYGVLSYHHGNPDTNRGRPAGFWELYSGDLVVGVIVQSISNKLDGGVIRARAFSRINPISYGKTLEALYKAGIPLLNQALLNLESNSHIESKGQGTLYTLPKNREVLGLLSRQIKNVFKRFWYGAFIEKKWKVSYFADSDDWLDSRVLFSDNLTELALPENSVFAADPCGSYLNGIYCEVLNEKSGKGEIKRWENNKWEKLNLEQSNHFSYPQIVEDCERVFLFPEIASWSCPKLFELSRDGMSCIGKHELQGLEETRLVDATLFKSEDTWFIFAGDPETSHQKLKLFYSSSIYGPYIEHVKSPIALDPRSSRMAGPIFVREGEIYRFAQNCSSSYGDGITVNRILILSKTDYQEHLVNEMSIANQKGPHTLMISDGKVWLDSYTEKFAPLAGWRRLKSKLL